jgi:hypothetical protein
MDGRRTFEDFFDMKKKDLKAYLKEVGLKISGNKRELAQRAFDQLDTNRALLNHDTAGTSSQDKVISNEQIPEIQKLSSGWNSDPKLRPTLSHKDIEIYLLNSSHRTGDKGKMLCYRQLNRGYNFFNEQYIHKVMTNIVNKRCCYIRSKCFPSMKQGTYYSQWILVTRDAPH